MHRAIRGRILGVGIASKWGRFERPVAGLVEIHVARIIANCAEHIVKVCAASIVDFSADNIAEVCAACIAEICADVIVKMCAGIFEICTNIKTDGRAEIIVGIGP